MAELLEVRNLSLVIGGKPILKGINLELEQGASLGLVGESGSGKSMTALAVTGLLPRGASVTGGQVFFKGQDLLALEEEPRRRLRGSTISMVFQEPSSCLNPVMRVGRQIAEVMELHQGLDSSAAEAEAVFWLEKVGIHDAAQRARQYPHQFSGGMRQRVMIAMALACRPALLIADEPTTALDVTVQAQVLSLIKSMCAELGVTLLLISHDLGVIHAMADSVAVMKDGEVVEQGGKKAVFEAPQHPYTRILIDSYLNWAGAA